MPKSIICEGLVSHGGAKCGKLGEKGEKVEEYVLVAASHDRENRQMVARGLISRTYTYNTVILACGTNEEVIGLDIPIYEEGFVDGLDAGDLEMFGVSI
jgi:hypothetical protein